MTKYQIEYKEDTDRDSTTFSDGTGIEMYTDEYVAWLEEKLDEAITSAWERAAGEDI